MNIVNYARTKRSLMLMLMLILIKGDGVVAKKVDVNANGISTNCNPLKRDIATVHQTVYQSRQFLLVSVAQGTSFLILIPGSRVWVQEYLHVARVSGARALTLKWTLDVTVTACQHPCLVG